MHSGNLSLKESTYIQARVAEGYELRETLRGDFSLSPDKVIGWLRGANENSEIQSEILKQRRDNTDQSIL